jgi:hypothetical protein
MDKLTSSLEERHVKTSPLPENAWDLMVEEASSLSTLYDYALKLEHDGCVGKMSPQLYPAITVKTLPDSSLSSAAGKSPSPAKDGEKQESSPMPPDTLVWRGEFLTLNIPEWNNFRGRSRSEGNVSSLSDILIVGNIPARYYLTVKCAEGILRRSARRGKQLPAVLKEALIRQS